MIIVRHATDDFIALQVARAMEEAGANVFCITPYGTGGGFAVWAKVADENQVALVDRAITQAAVYAR